MVSRITRDEAAPGLDHDLEDDNNNNNAILAAAIPFPVSQEEEVLHVEQRPSESLSLYADADTDSRVSEISNFVDFNADELVVLPDQQTPDQPTEEDQADGSLPLLPTRNEPVMNLIPQDPFDQYLFIHCKFFDVSLHPDTDSPNSHQLWRSFLRDCIRSCWNGILIGSCTALWRPSRNHS